MNTFIENQNWRYATKKFDNSKKVSQESINILIESIRLSASSYGLQPYKLIIVESKEIREQLKPVSWNQAQITDASHLFVLASYIEVTEKIIDEYVQLMANERNIPVDNLSPYGDFMKSKILDLPKEQQKNWSAKQAYIAMGNLLHAAAELKIDVTPMEGFESDAYDKILNLESQNLYACLVAPIGYRHDEDTHQNAKKVRISKENLIITL